MIKRVFTPRYPVSFVEQITEFLTNAILEGRLQNGQRLGENELQRQFGISRAPIKESFRILEKNGLIVITPRKGTYFDCS
jgi:DNA-binding GntR family transcriptional regulator